MCVRLAATLLVKVGSVEPMSLRILSNSRDRRRSGAIGTPAPAHPCGSARSMSARRRRYRFASAGLIRLSAPNICQTKLSTHGIS